MEMITTDELGAMMAREFTHIHEKFDHLEERMDKRFDQVDERFDKVETRLTRVEEICDDLTGKLIRIDDRLSKVEYRLEGVESILKVSSPIKLKKRVEKLETHTFGAIQPA